jgi:hypothetical protein
MRLVIYLIILLFYAPNGHFVAINLFLLIDYQG